MDLDLIGTRTHLYDGIAHFAQLNSLFAESIADFQTGSWGKQEHRQGTGDSTEKQAEQKA